MPQPPRRVEPPLVFGAQQICPHIGAVPVNLLDGGETVAWLCQACEAQLPPGWEPDPRPNPPWYQDPAQLTQLIAERNGAGHADAGYEQLAAARDDEDTAYQAAIRARRRTDTATVVPGEYFDALGASLDQPAAPNDRTRQAAARLRDVVQHPCPCCVFGNHAEQCACDGADCCHPERHGGEHGGGLADG